MGYTHYWYKNIEANEDVFKEKYTELLPIVKKIVSLAGLQLEGLLNDEQIYLNGLDGEGCEAFRWSSKMATGMLVPCDEENFPESASFTFCKTQRRPYDVVVVASLCAIEHIYGRDLVRVSSDGGKNDEEWLAGKALFEKALNEMKS